MAASDNQKQTKEQQSQYLLYIFNFQNFQISSLFEESSNNWIIRSISLQMQLLSKQNLVNKCSFDELGLLQVIEVFTIKNNK